MHKDLDGGLGQERGEGRGHGVPIREIKDTGLGGGPEGDELRDQARGVRAPRMGMTEDVTAVRRQAAADRRTHGAAGTGHERAARRGRPIAHEACP